MEGRLLHAVNAFTHPSSVHKKLRSSSAMQSWLQLLGFAFYLSGGCDYISVMMVNVDQNLGHCNTVHGLQFLI